MEKNAAVVKYFFLEKFTDFSPYFLAGATLFAGFCWF